ncbi:MAG: XRE family transcriptional regulator [Bacilli bacterium]|nr:XRE family transcriptional regulator [Bacilli bacterium]MDE7181930.1 XRE family transcriptional regulator [Clostridia bacterium]
MKFELKHFNQSIITFEYESKTLEGDACRILSVTENTTLLPIGMEVSDKGLMAWLKSRVIPKNREFVETILSKMGLSTKDTLGIIKICKGLSLNDCYWVVEEGFDGKFENYNLYRNRFSQTLALIAYTGHGSTSARKFTSSPEFTTQGMLKKCWRRIDGKIYLYKGGTMGAANTGNEPYSEYYAAQIAKTMGIGHVPYGLSKWKGTLSSTCELFTSIDTAYIPIWRFVEKDTLLEIAEKLKCFGLEFYDRFVDMLVFDALIYNTDRHTGNFGLLVDSRTNEAKEFAPVFDNGLSLFNFAMDDDLADLEKYSKTRHPALGGSYEEVVKNFITDRQLAKLRKMINFKFKLHPRYNLPKERLKIIEKFLQQRVQELLRIKN